MDLADLPETLATVVLQWCPLVEMHCHWELPGLNLDDRGWVGEEPLVLGEVLHPQRGRHDEQLQWQVPLWDDRLRDHGHLG